MCTRGNPPFKAYVVVFVCIITKALHIEMVSSLSTDSFHGALKRLIARRVRSSDVFCDNAKLYWSKQKVTSAEGVPIQKGNHWKDKPFL